MWSSYKVQFKCPGCKETFSVQTKFLLEKEKVVCSCCDYEYPNEVILGIKESIKAASRAFVYVRDNKIKGLEFDFIPWSEGDN